MSVEFERFGAPNLGTIVLAHGAGAGMDSLFMTSFGQGLAKRGLEVILFEFPYMQKRREDGKKRPPDRAPKLLAYYQDVLNEMKLSGSVVIGGKSMGGRIASMLLAENNKLASGLLLLGYPFAPPGKPEKLRVDHFPEIENPTLIIQGERDTFGGQKLLNDIVLPDNFDIVWSRDGDHSFKPRKKSGLTEDENWNLAMDAIVDSKLFK
ncbi:MAG: alpha/beta fold hydrolase [Kordiimonas sp.]